jgi:hypothetical protein
MSDNLKDKIQNAGKKVAEQAKEAGAAAKSGAEKAADWVKDKSEKAGEKTSDAAKATGQAIKDAGQKIRDKA